MYEQKLLGDLGVYALASLGHDSLACVKIAGRAAPQKGQNIVFWQCRFWWVNTHILHFEVNATKVHRISSPKAEGIAVYQL